MESQRGWTPFSESRVDMTFVMTPEGDGKMVPPIPSCRGARRNSGDWRLGTRSPVPPAPQSSVAGGSDLASDQGRPCELTTTSLGGEQIQSPPLLNFEFMLLGFEK
jgi:hypothetical protein